MNYSLNVKSSSIVHTLLSNCVKLLGKVQKLLIKCISYSVISKRIRVVSPKFYTARKNFTGPPVPTVPTNFKSAVEYVVPLKIQTPKNDIEYNLTKFSSYLWLSDRQT